jgi:hypothetical protein
LKKRWYLSVLVISAIVIVLFTGCPSKDDGGSCSFTYDGNTYSLTNGIIEDWGGGDFDIYLASSGIDAVHWTGKGDFVFFDLISPSTIAAPGTYDWAATGGFELWDGGIGLNWDADTDNGTWFNADWTLQESGDYVTISVSGNTYTVEFSITLQNGKVVTGSFTGPLSIV